MSGKMKKTPLRLHTFAGDLNVERNKRGLSSEQHSAVTHKEPLSKIPKKETLPKPAPKRNTIPKIAIPTKKKEASPSHQLSKNVPHTITHIPAFHEIKKHTEPKHNDAPSAKLIKIEKKKLVPSNDEYDSMVITDTKISDFKLFPSIFTSIKSYLKELATHRKKKKIPTYKVPETTSRRGVIQRATSKTGTIFTANNETLKEQIRRRREAPQEATDLDKTKTNWSPYTEPGYDLLGSPDQERTSNVIVEYKKQTPVIPFSEQVVPTEKKTFVETTGAVPQPSRESKIVSQPEEKALWETPVSKKKEKDHEIVETIPSTEKKTFVETTGAVPQPSRESKIVSQPEEKALWETPVSKKKEKDHEIVETIPSTEKKTFVETTGAVPQPSRESKIVSQPEEKALGENTESTTTEKDHEIVETIPSTDEPEILQPDDSTKLPPSQSKLLNQFKTNTITVTLVIVFVSILFIVHLIMTRLDNLSNETTVTAIPLLEDTKLVNILLNESEVDKLPQLLHTAITSAPTGAVELSIVSADRNRVSASYLFEILGFNTSPSLQQSITYTRFVTVNQSDPVLIITFVDKNTVLGGLLSWEETMADDMRSLYPIPTEITGEFIDETLEEIDIRILRNYEDVVLVYGFINDNTLLIAPNVSDFTQVTQHYFVY
ncbi:MAG: hypothetical protein ACI9BF_000209 [Candidatus Paceibacteria bacterium]|jgi:hypothetical protein